ncbi:MAG: hypothetical protein ACRD5F_00470 [Candidatus Acidiferrales bacterium]
MSANPQIAELVLANRLLTVMASRVSENLATFSSWLIGSFAGILALLIANLSDLSEVLPAKAVGTSASIFLIAVGLHVLQRYLAAIVAGGAIVTREAEALPTPAHLDFTVVFRQLERATFWPTSILVRRMLARVQAGDLAAGGRLYGKLAQIQSYLVFGQLAFVVWAALKLAKTL